MNRPLYAVAAFAVAVHMVSAATVLAKGSTETIDAPREVVWKAALVVVAEEFTLNDVNREDGVISFRSGTQDASVLVIDVSESKTAVTVNAKAARAGLSIGFGVDGKNVRKKFLARLRSKVDALQAAAAAAQASPSAKAETEREPTAAALPATTPGDASR